MKVFYQILFAAMLLASCGTSQGARTEQCAVHGAEVERGEVLVGATDTAAYMPLLRERRVAVLANHTAMFSADEHLVDMLHREGVNVVGIFSPEHGFRGRAEAGAAVVNSVDERTQIPIFSLYNGNTKRPSDLAMQSFDVLIVDMQDVGLRFYTYYISMLRMIDACADFDREVIILDRPNPNGHYVDGPILDMRYKSGVGHIPVPVVHGLTMGEIALMAMGEGWTKCADVTIIKCRNYDHQTHYTLPVAPSPNLTTQHSIYLYPSLCLFEGTVVSLGRGTEAPFEIYGHPDMKGRQFSFTPRSVAAASEPPLMDEMCYGEDLRNVDEEQIWQRGVDLSYVIDAYNDLQLGDKFFKPMFEKLIGVDWVRRMIIEGYSSEEIKARWKEEVEEYKVLRRKYLLYNE